MYFYVEYPCNSEPYQSIKQQAANLDSPILIYLFVHLKPSKNRIIHTSTKSLIESVGGKYSFCSYSLKKYNYYNYYIILVQRLRFFRPQEGFEKNRPSTFHSRFKIKIWGIILF